MIEYEMTPSQQELVEAALDHDLADSVCDLCQRPVLVGEEHRVVSARNVLHLVHQTCISKVVPQE